MGVSLTYRTAAPVPASVIEAILAEAGRLNRERDWWSEGIIFFEADRGKKGCTPLVGDTKLFRSDVANEDDDFMGYRDAAFVIRQLAQWSCKYGIDWALEMAGATMLGSIRGGKVQPEGLFHWDQAETDADRERAARIQGMYAPENG